MMSEYEMLSLLQTYLSNGMTIMANYFTIFTAYLVVGHLAAHRLAVSMSLFITAAFIVSSALSVLLMFRVGMGMSALFGHMHSVAVSGKALTWTQLSTGPAPDVWSAGYAALAIMVGAVVGAIYFFFILVAEIRSPQPNLCGTARRRVGVALANNHSYLVE
jgi:hypothetical protein